LGAISPLVGPRTETEMLFLVFPVALDCSVKISARKFLFGGNILVWIH
jgi:hypothetical protein